MDHRNICCDGCNRQNFYGRRYKCLRCVNYDLCGDCYDQHVETHGHSVEHPMQLILEHHQLSPELIMAGETVELIHMPNCYSCPYCFQFGHTAKQLIDHVSALHSRSDSHVVCPMCAALPGLELVAIRNLARHLLLNHVEHANLLDPDTPPLRRPSGRPSRRRRRQMNAAIPSTDDPNHSSHSYSSPTSYSSHNNIVDSEVGIDILFEISEIHRMRAAVNVSPEWPSRPLSDSLVEISEDEVHSVATESISNSSTRTLEELSISLPTTSTTPARPDAERYLLLQWMTAEHNRTRATDQAIIQRYQHAMFTEHILLSMLCDAELQPQPAAMQSESPPTKAEAAAQAQLKQGQRLTVVMKQKQERVPLPRLPRLPKIMELMSLPWAKQRLHFITLQGATLDESEINDNIFEDDID